MEQMSENGAKISDNYHSDHSIPVGMGSSAFITRADGEVEQHLQYMPFGETFIDQRMDEWSSRYTFSAKEKDMATGYNYFGARYYDSEVSVWLSVDPLADKHPDYTPYAYVYNNPLNLIDPFGLDSIQLNRDGTTNVVATTEDNFDVYIATDKKGNLDRSKTHILYDEDVRDIRTDTQDYKEKNKKTGKKETKTATIDFYEIDDYDKAKDFFEFAAENTDVEWAHTIIGSSTRSVVTTSRLEKGEASGLYFYVNNYYIVDRRHSHPNNWKASKTDRENVPVYESRHPKSKLFYIYHKGSYYEYDFSRTSKAPNQIPKKY